MIMRRNKHILHIIVFILCLYVLISRIYLMTYYLLNKDDIFLLFLNLLGVVICIYIVLYKLITIKLNGIILRALQIVTILYTFFFFLWTLFEFLIQDPPMRIVRLICFDIPNILILLLSVYFVFLLGYEKKERAHGDRQPDHTRTDTL